MRGVLWLFYLLFVHGQSSSVFRVAASPTWNFTLKQHMLARGLTYKGSGNALRRFIGKLNNGEQVVVSALGGSITHGHGGPPDADNPDKGFPNSWSRLVFDFIQLKWPKSTHVYYNGAVPATGASYFVSCLFRHVHPNADLYLIDLAVNGAGLKDTEGIVRQLMHARGGVSHSPLIFFVNFWNNWPGRNDELAKKPWRTLIGDDDETHINTVAMYYDCMCASMRNAYMYEDMHNEPGFDYESYIYGGNHPNARGHRMMADLVVSQLLHGIHSLDGDHTYTYTDWLPPPIVDDNYSENTVGACVFGKDLLKYATRNDGWVFHDDKSKPGMWANNTQASLEISLPVIPAYRKLRVFFLRSWMPGMGTVKLSCLPSGCTCDAHDISGHGDERSSVTTVHDTDIQVVGERCMLLFTSLSGSFKLIGVASATPAYIVEGRQMS